MLSQGLGVLKYQPTLKARIDTIRSAEQEEHPDLSARACSAHLAATDGGNKGVAVTPSKYGSRLASSAGFGLRRLNRESQLLPFINLIVAESTRATQI